MPVSPESAVLLFVVGAASGIAGAVLGTGGGVFLIPILVLGFGLPMHLAVGTSILCVIATSSAVASVNVERGTANMRLGMTLEIGTSLGAISGGLLAVWLSAPILETIFAIVLVPTAVLMWRGRGETGPDVPTPAPDSVAANSGDALSATYHDPQLGRDVSYRVRRLWAGFGISIVAGLMSGLLGIGGGVFKVPALVLFCAVPIRAAAATSNFMIGVTAAASAFLYFGRGDVQPLITATVVLGVLAGSAVGTYVNRFVGGRLIQRTFAVLLIGVAIEMLFRVVKSGGSP